MESNDCKHFRVYFKGTTFFIEVVSVSAIGAATKAVNHMSKFFPERSLTS